MHVRLFVTEKRMFSGAACHPSGQGLELPNAVCIYHIL